MHMYMYTCTSHNYMYFGTHCVPYMDTKKVKTRSILNNASYFTSTCTLNMYMYILCTYYVNVVNNMYVNKSPHEMLRKTIRVLFGGGVGGTARVSPPLAIFKWKLLHVVLLVFCHLLNCSRTCTCKWNPESRQGDTTQQKDKATQHGTSCHFCLVIFYRKIS